MTRASDLARLISAGGTFGGAITSNSGIVIDNITIDGTEIDLSSGDVTLDAALDIKLDAAGGDIKFLSDGTEYGEIRNISSDLTIISSVADKDIVFKGQDDSSEIEAMRIDMSVGGFVGMGTSSPSTVLHLRGADGTSTLTVGNTTENTALTIRTSQDDRVVLRAEDGGTARSMAFETGTSEKMRIDSGGSIGINTPVIAGYRLAILTNGSAEYQAIFKSSNTSGTQYHLGFNRDTTQAGHLTSNANNQVALNNGSDYRLKENISDMTDGIERVKQLQPKKFSFLSNPDKEIVDGFLAHEVKDLVPYSVLGEKDAVDKDGEPVMQTIDITSLIPVLTGAIKELIAKVETLETNINDLQKRVTVLESS
jgi:hypothetical protein|tara:strand:- start:323 stop:1423 length:1101 start_codon:yes stop_codon:yes gene_type:complete